MSNKTENASSLYYFYSVGCGFCKKVDPIVDELIKDGNDILKLDVSDANNAKLSKELKEKYKIQCGTPWFIDAETGHQICGFREKDILLKWVNGEDIPQPPRPKSPPPKLPFNKATDEEIADWKAKYTDWAEENKHLPNMRTVDELLKMPRPNSDPPPPPKPDFTDEQLLEWKSLYNKWAGENNHLPNMVDADQILERMRPRQTQNSPGPINEIKHVKNLNTEFYYTAENNKKYEVHADGEYIKTLNHQYYIREKNGLLTKVVDDVGWTNKQTSVNKPPMRPQPVKQHPKGLPGPPASNKPPKRKRAKKGSK